MTELAAWSRQWMKWEHSQTSVDCMNPGAVLAAESGKVMVSAGMDMAILLPVFTSR